MQAVQRDLWHQAVQGRIQTVPSLRRASRNTRPKALVHSTTTQIELHAHHEQA